MIAKTHPFMMEDVFLSNKKVLFFHAIERRILSKLEHAISTFS